MLRRRLTALLASLLLLPSILSGGGEGCVMGGLLSVRGEGGSPTHDHGQHSLGHAAHHAGTDALVNEADASSPLGVPHAPTQCILVMGCGAAVIAAAEVAIDEPAFVVSGMYADVLLAPDSPSLGLEPPPPRV
jgi:hypothetical protein